MRQPLKERIQNAINQTIYNEEVGYGALIVGGRRVTRRKRKHKTVKKDQNNNTNKKTNKSKKLFKGKNEEAKNTEKSALVKHDSLEEELQDTDTQESAVSMPFFKKKAKKEPEAEKPEEKIDLKPADVPEVKPAEDGTATVTVTIPNDVAPAESNIPEKSEQPAEEEKKMADEEVKPISVKDAIKEIEAADGGNEKPDVAPGEEPNGKVTEETKDDLKKEDKKENTPLIEKESKVKDTGPGCLCCHIL